MKFKALTRAARCRKMSHPKLLIACKAASVTTSPSRKSAPIYAPPNEKATRKVAAACELETTPLFTSGPQLER